MHAWIVISNVFKEKKLNTYLSGRRKKRLSRLGWLSFMVSSNSKVRWHQNPCSWFKCFGWLPESITTGDQGDVLWRLLVEFKRAQYPSLSPLPESMTTGDQGDVLWRLLVELKRAQYPISESLTARDLGYVFPHSFFYSPYKLCCDFFSNWELLFLRQQST